MHKVIGERKMERERNKENKRFLISSVHFICLSCAMNVFPSLFVQALYGL